MANHIKVLDKAVALKIAAGEVIDRPASVLRELLDNSIDAGSSEITVHLYSGGMKEIRIIDNGSGMEKEDLEICYFPHSTSKIENIEDIYRIWTLGFRGEALSSIASSAKTEIISSPCDSGEGYTLVIDNGRTELSPSRANRGTVVSVRDLFYMLPARKHFLKSPSAETGLCRNIFLEKAASNPDITFRLFIDDKMAFFLAASSLSERITACYPSVFKSGKMCREIEYKENSFSIKGILNSADITRKDRKYIHIYLNGRRIQEYSLLQAVVFGYSEYIPGGVFPSAVIFINDDPQLVDFNIHPAKKEARIKNLQLIHHALSETVSSAIAETGNREMLEFRKTSSPDYTQLQREFSVPSESEHMAVSETIQINTDTHHFHYERGQAETDKADEVSDIRGSSFRYIGSLFNLFLICEKDDAMYLIDQHAAHEKIIFETLSSQNPDIQPLLIPLYPEKGFELTEKMIGKYKEIGIIIKKDDSGDYFIDAMPARFFAIKNEVLKILTEYPGNTAEIRKELYAAYSCRKAVKQGDSLSHGQAVDIIEKAFSLKTPFCPHGRPVWKKITKQELLEEINRII